MSEIIDVKFNKDNKLYSYTTNFALKPNDKVIVETIRGKELATVIKSYFTKAEDKDMPLIMRLATTADLEQAKKLEIREKEVFDQTSKLIKKYSLQMKLTDVSFTIDGSKVIISYVCEERVDFRELVKELAQILKVRIELRQIGVRDQAKVLGAIGNCGKEICCKQYLNDFDKVSIKMAKTQNLSLNPTKISGVCGRLMCCLSYENDYYSEMQTKMPRINSLVSCPDGEGTVIYNDLLKGNVTIKITKDNDVKLSIFPYTDVKVLNKEFKNDSKR